MSEDRLSGREAQVYEIGVDVYKIAITRRRVETNTRCPQGDVPATAGALRATRGGRAVRPTALKT